MGSTSSFWDDCEDNLKKCGKKTKQSNKVKLWSQPDMAGTLTPNNQSNNSSLKIVLTIKHATKPNTAPKNVTCILKSSYRVLYSQHYFKENTENH